MMESSERLVVGHLRMNSGMACVRFFMMLLALGIALGCGTPSKEILDEAATPVPKEFLLGPEDVLEVTVWRNQDLSRTVVIRPDGKVSLPLIGDVQASGLSTSQVADKIAARLTEFKENPVVTVTVKEVNSYYVYVLGEVTKPGKYQLKSHATVLQVVALASGFTLYASKNKIKVLRRLQDEDGKTREIRIPVRYDDLISGTGESRSFLLKTGDVIVVP